MAERARHRAKPMTPGSAHRYVSEFAGIAVEPESTTLPGHRAVLATRASVEEIAFDVSDGNRLSGWRGLWMWAANCHLDRLEASASTSGQRQGRTQSDGADLPRRTEAAAFVPAFCQIVREFDSDHAQSP